ncbi:xylan glycosyltransferase MUCI21-like isoform X2 [Wolffia australiana]
MAELLPGESRAALEENGVACVAEPESEYCVTTGAVRVAAGPARSATVYLSGGQRLAGGARDVRPYPRRYDARAMRRTAPVHVVAGEGGAPPCEVTHGAPAVVFSTGGYAGNFFHDVSEELVPLFLTAGRLRWARLVVTDYEPFWPAKYRRVLERLAGGGLGAALVVASSPSHPPARRVVHCFPAAVVGLKFHGHLACNASAEPGGATIGEFRRFLWAALGVKHALAAAREEPPLLVLISRKGSRELLNEAAVAAAAEEAGFRVEVAQGRELEGFAGTVARAAVLAGVHGAGLTNLVFLREGAVVLQVVPWGLDWAAETYFGRPAEAMGLQYLQYKVTAEESTLSETYPKGHPVLADPWGVNRRGYNVSQPIFTQGQKLRLDIARFSGVLREARRRAGAAGHGLLAPPP